MNRSLWEYFSITLTWKLCVVNVWSLLEDSIWHWINRLHSVKEFRNREFGSAGKNKHSQWRSSFLFLYVFVYELYGSIEKKCFSLGVMRELLIYDVDNFFIKLVFCCVYNCTSQKCNPLNHRSWSHQFPTPLNEHHMIKDRAILYKTQGLWCNRLNLCFECSVYACVVLQKRNCYTLAIPIHTH